MNIIIAGASFPCGVSELGKVARRQGFAPIFIDHPKNKSTLEDKLFSWITGDKVPNIFFKQHGIFLPLLESWVSVGIHLPIGNALRFDRHAAIVSRSKELLSATLADAGCSHVPRYRVCTLQDALRAAANCGYPVVLRADTGYSSRGIWVAESAEELRTVWSLHMKERSSLDFAEMRSVMMADADNIIIEPWLPGREWSIDCIIRLGRANLIRVCEKATGVVFGRPTTLGYRLTADSALWAEIGAAARKWCSVLFHTNDFSFACFDIRRNHKNDFVPLDFGVRLGGDCIPLLVRHAGKGRNPYAAALDAGLTCDMSRMVSPEAGHALIHAFACRPGAYEGLRIIGQGVVVKSWKHGLLIGQRQNGIVHHRVATVRTYFDNLRDFDIACAKSSEWLQVVVK